MARETEKLEDWVTYVPDVDDNRIDPDPLTVEIHPMSAEEWRSFQRGIAVGKPKGAYDRTEKAVRRILSERVRNICGYKANGVAIRTGAELFDHGEPVVYDDVFEAITNISTLSAGLLGKLKSRSASLPAVTATHGGGVAPAVAGKNNPTSQTPSAGAPAIATASEQHSPSIGLRSSIDAPGLS